MAVKAWLMVAYNNIYESSASGKIDYVMGNDGTWIEVASDPNFLDSAAIYLDSEFTIERIRVIQADFQSKYADRDVRMERCKLTITYPDT